MLAKILRSTLNGLRGLAGAYQFDQSFRMEIWGSLIFVFVGWLIWPLEPLELILLVLSYGLILITELINTSVERMLERLHPEIHDLVGQSKDIASAAVLVAFVVAGIIVLALLANNFGLWF